MHRIKHIKTGLYYQPGVNNFSKKGKVYFNNQDALAGTNKCLGICMKLDSKIVKSMPDYFKNWEKHSYMRKIFNAIDKSEFIREEINQENN